MSFSHQRYVARLEVCGYFAQKARKPKPDPQAVRPFKCFGERGQERFEGGLRVGGFSRDLGDSAQPRRAAPREGRDLTPTIRTICFNLPALKSLLLVSGGLRWALTRTWPNKTSGFMCLPLWPQYLAPVYWTALGLNFSDLFSIQHLYSLRLDPNWCWITSFKKDTEHNTPCMRPLRKSVQTRCQMLVFWYIFVSLQNSQVLGRDIKGKKFLQKADYHKLAIQTNSGHSNTSTPSLQQWYQIQEIMDAGSPKGCFACFHAYRQQWYSGTLSTTDFKGFVLKACRRRGTQTSLNTDRNIVCHKIEPKRQLARTIMNLAGIS